MIHLRIFVSSGRTWYSRKSNNDYLPISLILQKNPIFTSSSAFMYKSIIQYSLTSYVVAAPPILLRQSFAKLVRFPEKWRYSRMSTDDGKKLVKIDIVADTVCSWCFVGKKNLDQAMQSVIGQQLYEFEVRWHPFQLNPTAPKEGIDKREYYRRKFGSQSERMEARMSEVFRTKDLEYNMSGLTGNTMDSHRLIYFAGQQGLDKQHNLVEELSLGYFTQGKYIGDRLSDTPQGDVPLLETPLKAVHLYDFLWEFLLECGRKVGIEGAEEFLNDPNNGLKEVEDDLNTYARNVTGVPYFVINGDYKFSGAQPFEVFKKAFALTTGDDD